MKQPFKRAFCVMGKCDSFEDTLIFRSSQQQKSMIRFYAFLTVDIVANSLLLLKNYAWKSKIH